MTFLAYGFLALERQRAQDVQAADGPNVPGASIAGGSPARRVTLPGVRRALQRLLTPPCRFACTACIFYARSGFT
jgi:hypothetical protein